MMIFRTGDLFHVPQGIVLYSITEDYKKSFRVTGETSMFFKRRIEKPTVGVYLGRSLIKRYHDVNIDGEEAYIFDDDLENLNFAKGSYAIKNDSEASKEEQTQTST